MKYDYNYNIIIKYYDEWSTTTKLLDIILISHLILVALKAVWQI